MIQVTAFEKEIRNSSSLPLIVKAADGRRYVVKLRGGGEGVIVHAVEWLTVQLGGMLGLPVLEPALLVLPSGLVGADQDPDILEPAEKSVGINFGTVLLEEPFEYRPGLAYLDREMRRRIFLFDLWLLNIDRHRRNPNMIIHGDRLLLLDFACAMAVRGCLERGSVPVQAFLARIRAHPFYESDLDWTCFAETVSGLNRQRMTELAASLPEDWIATSGSGGTIADRRRMLSERLTALTSEVGRVLEERLASLKQVRLESEAERKQRILENKEAFERRRNKL